MSDIFFENQKKRRCNFSPGRAVLSEKSCLYHDTRWCKAEHRDGELYAMLVLESMQAGLSWDLILKKETAIRAAFGGLEPKTVALYDENKIDCLMCDGGIVRNRRKIEAAVNNAKMFLKVQAEYGSFDAYIWKFTEGRVIDHHLKDIREMPAQDALSRRVSADLEKRGFRFVGPTIVYSYLQSIGVINDHCDFCDFKYT